MIRLLDAGRCQLGGHNYLFVVMDHAEQNLAQILPSRPLTPDEVRDLLPATVDVLAYLHGKNLVQGGLKPPNFLVVDDQLKLASDTIRPAGERTASTAPPSLYDPPEANNGRGSTTGDIWALGITLVEALTQTPPAWSRESSESVSLPANLAPEFVDTVQRCLNRDPAQRPAAADLVAQFKRPPPATSPSATPPVMSEPLVRTVAPTEFAQDTVARRRDHGGYHHPVGGLDWAAPVSYPRQCPAPCFDNPPIAPGRFATGYFARGRRGDPERE